MQEDSLFKKKIICIIQCRLSSKRLKNKILLNLKNKLTSLEIILEKINKLKFVDKIIIASGNKKKNILIKSKLKLHKYNFYFGSENNVSKRFYDIIKKNRNSIIIRVTADNPYTESSYIKFLVKKIQNSRYKFVMMNNYKIPYGSGVEVFDGEYYLKNYEYIKSKYDKEHVYEHLKKRNLFKMYEPINKIKCFPFRVTMDTEEDYIFLKYLFKKDINTIKDIQNKFF